MNAQGHKRNKNKVWLHVLFPESYTISRDLYAWFCRALFCYIFRHARLPANVSIIWFSKCQCNRPISQIPQCTRQTSHNTPFCSRNAHTCTHFCYKMVHCRIWDWCVVGFLQQLNSKDMTEIDTQIAKLMGPTWSPPGTCRPRMGPMLALWTLLSG